MRLTLATDGSRLGMQVDFAESMSMAMPNIDLSAIRVNAVVHPGGDSVSVGVVFPPELAAMTGGGIGFRMDLPIPDTVRNLPGPDVDSMMSAETPKVTNTGRTSIVAGINCEEWELTPAQPSDSTPFNGPMKLCLAESVPGLKAFSALAEQYLPDFGFDFSAMKEMGRKWFGDRDLIAIRTVMGAADDMVVQLESSV